MKYNSEQKELIANHLLELGKERIDRAGIRTIDYIATVFVEALVDIGADKQADLLYEYYTGGKDGS